MSDQRGRILDLFIDGCLGGSIAPRVIKFMVSIDHEARSPGGLTFLMWVFIFFAAGVVNVVFVLPVTSIKVSTFGV